MKPLNFIKALSIDIFAWSYVILVCWKIIFEKIIQHQRYPDFSWNQPIYSLAIGTVLALILFQTRMSLGRGMMGMMRTKKDHAVQTFSPFACFGYFILFLTFIAGFQISQVSLKEFFSFAGLEGAHRIFSALFHPNWSILEEGVFAAVETIYMAFIATAFAIPIAFILGFFSARNLMVHTKTGWLVYWILRLISNLSRSIEPLVWAIIFSVWVGIGPFSGMLALWLHSIASLIKQYSEQIESINDGPMEAMTATGAHPIQVVWFGVVPQIVLPYLSYTIFRWDINVRMATVIGLVGGGGLGNLLMQYQGQARWNEVGTLVIIIAVIVWVMDWASSKLREALK